MAKYSNYIMVKKPNIGKNKIRVLKILKKIYFLKSLRFF